MRSVRLSCLLISVCGVATPALADPPAGYYDTITGTDGPTISTQLGTLLNNAITRSYGDARTLLQDVDEDPNNLSNIILVYNDASVTSTWDSGSTWNREHTWPRSLGVGDSGSDYSDLHQLHPCNPSINTSRGNKQFGTLPGQWDPNLYGHDYRGRMARMAFYMKTRYSYLNIPTLGSQSLFIDWHIQNMPGEIENRRNDRIYTYQQNRNAFADRPEWVWAIFGTGPSDAQIVIDGESSVDGATSSVVDLGTVIGDVSSLPAYTLNLNKTGAAPTTYRVTTSGDVAQVSQYQFGAERNTRSLSHDISFTGTGFGPYTGTVTVENTEVTTTGSGFGSSDGDDTLTITADVVDHSLASLDPSSVVTSITIDFGTLNPSDDPAIVDIDVHNIGLPGMSAALDIDAVTITGNSTAFDTDFAPTAGISAGGSEEFGIDFNNPGVGSFSATAFLDVSDEDLPGAAGQQILIINMIAQVVSDCVADVNGDGMLTPTDFTAWINAYNGNLPGCDQNNDGMCSPTDFTAWVNNFNTGC
ncbi:MAG: hypothetical protein Phyf2KO_15870 [Phycisphaerales bacterium]